MPDRAAMNEFLDKIAKILEVESVSDADDLKAFPQWDSLTVLSVIAMLDADYGVNLRAADLQEAASAGALWKLVQSKKAR
jgi:acyl carrier protein